MKRASSMSVLNSNNKDDKLRVSQYHISKKILQKNYHEFVSPNTVLQMYRGSIMMNSTSYFIIRQLYKLKSNIQ